MAISETSVPKHTPAAGVVNDRVMSEITNVVALREDLIPPHLRPPQLIMPGDYELVCHSHSVERVFKRDVLVVWFFVGDYRAEVLAEVLLPRYYTIGVCELRGKRQIAGKRGGDLVAEFATLFGERGWRINRIPVSWFKNVRALGRVRTVTKSHDRKKEARRPYSVIAELKERL